MSIKDVENLAKPSLKSGEKIVSYESENLLLPGENYGSIMLALKIKICTEFGTERIVNCVAKTCPPPGFLWDVFDTKVTFKREIALYKTIVPTLNDFARQKGIAQLIRFVAECRGARISLDPSSEVVDENAVLLLENLKMDSYEIVNRFVGFDLETSKIILKDLATLHAAVIAYKEANLEEFRASILPYLSKRRAMDMPSDFEKQSYERIKKAYESIPECKVHLQKLEPPIKKMMEGFRNPPKMNEIFLTLTHNDLWTNNTMVKYHNGKPIANIIVDFQGIEFTSLADDILFFLYSSVELSILEEHLDSLMRFYYDVFIGILKQFNFDTRAYSFETLLEELALIGRERQFMHIVFMLTPIMTLKGKAKDLAEMKEDDILTEDSSLHENYYKRLKFVGLDFIRRGWL